MPNQENQLLLYVQKAFPRKTKLVLEFEYIYYFPSWRSLINITS